MKTPLHCLQPAPRCLLAFRGPDATRYLNGQITQDVRDLGDRALPSCVTDAKGRLQALVHVFRGADDDSIWIEGPANQAEELEARLTRYLIADEVEVENLSERWQLIHLVEPDPPPTAPPGIVRRSLRAGADGFDLWLPAGPLPDLAPLSAAEAESRRITGRIPAWGTELTPGMLPPEAGLDRNSISYHKGCYIGQEVLSRLKSAGRLNRKLAAFLVDPGSAAGDALGEPGATRPAGILTSVAPWPNGAGTHAALGYLDKSAFDAVELPVVGKPALARVLGFV
jgi:folate-binding protein YgfZ